MLESGLGTAVDAQAWDTEARAALAAGDFTRARHLFEKVLVVWRSLDNTDETIYGLLHITQMMRFEPAYQPAVARPLLEEAWQLAHQEGMASCIAPVKINLAVVALEEKEYRQALRYAQELLVESLQESNQERTTGMLWMIGIALTGLGHVEEGLRLYTAATACRERLGVDDVPLYIYEHHRHLLAPARRQVSPERLAVLEAEGQALSLEQVVATALAFTP